MYKEYKEFSTEDNPTLLKLTLEHLIISQL